MEKSRPGTPLIERFRRLSIPEPNSGCWLWMGALSPEGYGRLGITTPVEKKTHYAHRIAWRLFRGEIPQGKELDHLCRNRGCCNPDHLEPVTRSVNILRGALPGIRRRTHCPRGHEYSPENTKVDRRGGKTCQICAVAKRAAWKKAREAAGWRRIHFNGTAKWFSPEQIKRGEVPKMPRP